jgi:hypothetical protein
LELVTPTAVKVNAVNAITPKLTDAWIVPLVGGLGEVELPPHADTRTPRAGATAHLEMKKLCMVWLNRYCGSWLGAGSGARGFGRHNRAFDSRSENEAYRTLTDLSRLVVAVTARRPL